MHFLRTAQTKTCNQVCIYAAVFVLFDPHNQNKEARHGKVPELSEADLTNLTHRKDVTASGDRIRDHREPKTIAQVSQDAGFTTELGKGFFFCDSTSDKEQMELDTCLQRVHTTTRQSRYKIRMCYVW